MIRDAKRLIRAGFAVHLLRKKSKAPVNENWSKAPRLSYDQFCRRYKEGQNIGVRLGEPSLVDGLYLHVIDMDIRVDEAEDDAYDALHDLFPGVNLDELPTVKSGSGGASRHFYFGTTEPFPSKKLATSEDTFVDREGKKHRDWEIELFGTGKQVVLPPSIHPVTEKKYRWLVEFDEIDGLPEIDADRIADLITPSREVRHSNTSAINLPIQDLDDLLREIPHWVDDRDFWLRVGMAIQHEYSESPKLLDDAKEIFDDWSKNSKKYNKRENDKDWRSFKPDHENPITMRSILHEVHRKREEEICNEFDDLDDLDGLEGGDDEPRPLSKRQIINLFDDLEGEKESGGKSPLKYVPDDLYRKIKKTGVPDHVLTIPGKLQLAADYFNKTTINRQPQFAVQVALAIGSVTLGRNWKTDKQDFSSLYMANIGGSGSGKEHIETAIEKVLGRAEQQHLFQASSFTSESGLIGLLADCPRQIVITDEVGRELGTGRRSGDANKEGLETTLMSLFGKCGSSVRRRGYSRNGKTAEQIKEMMRPIVRPALTFLGQSVPDEFYSALSLRDVTNGFLNRFIVVESELISEPVDPFRDINDSEPPEPLLEWIRKHVFAAGGEEADDDEFKMMIDPNHTAPPRVVPISDAAKYVIVRLNEKIVKRQEALRERGAQDLYARTSELAKRIALIVALSCESDEIKEEHMQWAADYIFYYHQKMEDRALNNIGQTDVEKAAEAVLDYLRKKGRNGAAEHEIIDSKKAIFRGMDLRKREEVFALLKSEGKILRVEAKNKRGPRANWWAIA